MTPTTAQTQDASGASPKESNFGVRDLRNERASPDRLDRLAAQAEEQGAVRLLLELGIRFVPEGELNASERAAQREAIRNRQRAVRNGVTGTNTRIVREFDTVPAMAIVASPAGVQALKDVGQVARVRRDQTYEVGLDESVPLVRADKVWADGHTASERMVAVLDTGVDTDHAFFGGRVTEEACYSTEDPANDRYTLCPNGEETQTGSGAGVNCGVSNAACGHGTHVAGIAAGAGDSLAGVAKAAELMSVQVFHRVEDENVCNAPCLMAYQSDIQAGLERVYELRDVHDIAAANLSLGGGKATSPCDDRSMKAVVDNLRSANIATVAASGNNGWSNAVSFPACISSVVAVGSTSKSDEVSGFSNSDDDMLDLWAPGESITSSQVGGNFERKSGTSMAAPHVSGAWAIIRDVRPNASVSKILDLVKEHGVTVTDDRDADHVHSHARLDVYPAAFAGASKRLTTVEPCAVFDTRRVDDPKVGNGEERAFDVVGETADLSHQGGAQGGCGIPAEAVAVQINVVALNVEDDGNLFAFRGDIDRPADAGIVNFQRFADPLNNSNQIVLQVRKSNKGTDDVVVGANGGPADVRGIVSGYYTPTADLALETVEPCAVFDTRRVDDPKVGNGEERAFDVVGETADLSHQGGAQGGCGIPAEAVAVQINVVALNVEDDGNLFAFRGDIDRPADAGIVNFQRFADPLNNSNQIVLQVRKSNKGTDDVVVGANGGPADVRGIVSGYYTADA
jgi:subtilisin family serine protease